MLLPGNKQILPPCGRVDNGPFSLHTHCPDVPADLDPMTRPRGRFSLLQTLATAAALVALGAGGGAAAVAVYRAVDSDEALRWAAAIATSIAIVGMIGTFVVDLLVGWRSASLRTSNRQLTTEFAKNARRRAFEEELDRALTLVETEEEVIEAVRRAITRIDPERPVELHVLDAHRPVLRLAFSTFDNPMPDRPVSPWDSVAANTGKLVTYDTTERLDICPHLALRVTQSASAMCVPLTAMDRILGVLYALGPEGSEPTPAAIDALTLIANRAAAHIAVVRAFAAAEPTPLDPLSSLPNAHSVLTHIRSLVQSLTPFTIAIGDIDGFADYNDQHGRDAGDEAVVLMAGAFGRAIRPKDYLGRLTAEEFIAVFPDTHASAAARAVERVREHLVLEFTDSEVPSFTASFGVADSNSGTTIEEIVDTARRAVREAKQKGTNRVVIDDGHDPIDLDDAEEAG